MKKYVPLREVIGGPIRDPGSPPRVPHNMVRSLRSGDKSFIPQVGSLFLDEWRKTTGETKEQFARYVVLRWGEENAFPDSDSVEEYILDLLVLRDCLWYLEKIHKRKYLL